MVRMIILLVSDRQVKNTKILGVTDAYDITYSGATSLIVLAGLVLGCNLGLKRGVGSYGGGLTNLAVCKVQ